MEKLGAVILAAGLSSRMGGFKPLLTLGGQSLVSRVVAMTREVGADPVLVVTGYRHDTLTAHLAGSGVRCLHNPHYRESHMLDSLLLGLEALGGSCDRVLISPADVPLVRAETVRLLLAASEPFVRPVFHDLPGHPVVLDIKLLPYLRRYSGPGGLCGAVQSGPCSHADVPVTDRGVTLDCDTPDDYRQLERFYARQKF